MISGQSGKPEPGRREGLPEVTIPVSELDPEGISVVQLLVRAGLSGSGKDARRLIQGGGARMG